MQHLITTQQAVEGNLHQDGGFADSGTRHDKTHARGGVLTVQGSQRIFFDQVVVHHGLPPFL